MVKSKELAKILGVTVEAVNLARREGRITPLKREGREFVYDADQALSEYHNKTTQPKAINAPMPHDDDGDWDEFDEDGESAIDENGFYTDRKGNRKKKKSVLDIPSKFWSTHQAQNAKAIFDAQLKQHELDKEAGKYIATKIVETEVLRITSEFSRALVGLHVKLKNKIDKLDSRDIEAVKQLCADIIAECESNL